MEIGWAWLYLAGGGVNCQTTMNTNILSPVACPNEHKTEVTRISKLDVEIQSKDSIC